ncbi:hypothetical protein E4T85_21680 [Bacillus stratosphericus]|nr:hypothetical protein E4T85_21680 [Bacillus stratosphericus]
MLSRLSPIGWQNRFFNLGPNNAVTEIKGIYTLQPAAPPCFFQTACRFFGRAVAADIAPLEPGRRLRPGTVLILTGNEHHHLLRGGFGKPVRHGCGR